MTDNWDDVSYVISSRYRVEVLEQLSSNPSTPSRIASETGNPLAHVSRALTDLREESLVVLLVSEERSKGRVYGTTEKGDKVWETIEAENLV